MLLLQETLGESQVVVSLLESIFPLWSFIGMDAKGRSGGLAIGWNKNKVKLQNSWGFESGLGVEIICVDMGRSFTLLNIYGPYQDSWMIWSTAREGRKDRMEKP
jgi:hypothetical protein